MGKRQEEGRSKEGTEFDVEEFMAGVEWWRWCLTEGLAGRGEELAAPFFRLVKQPHRRTWFSDASFKAVGGSCLETRGVLEEQPGRGRECKDNQK